jgi:hypothetical protein
VALRLHVSAPPPPPDGRPSAPPGRVVARDRGDVRVVDHGGEALVVHDFAREAGEVHCADRHRLHELGYILLLSRVGAALDRLGLHRVHALGFVRDGRAALALLPMGGGKTTLALELLRRDDVWLLSEDTPLVDRRGRLHPFPVRFGVAADGPLPGVPAERQRVFHRRHHGTKVLIDIEHAAGRWVESGSVPPALLIVGGRAPSAAVSPAGRWAAGPALFWSLWLGVGVPQGREYLLRPRWAALVDLVRAACSRAVAALALWARCRVCRARLGPDAAENVRLLLRALERVP